VPVGPNGEALPYDQGAPAAPAGAAPQFPSLDPAAMAQLAMQIIAQQAGMDAQMVQQLVAEQLGQFEQQQQMAMAQMPDAIAAILAQLQAPPPEGIDEAGGMVESGDMTQYQQGPAAPGDEELMAMMAQQGALG
jgi:hypothetical protein